MKYFQKFIPAALLFLTINLSAQQWGMYTLYSVQNSTKAYLIDTNSTTFHQWNFATNAKTGYSSYLLPGGVIIRSVAKTGNSFNGGGMTGQIQKVDWDNNVLWNFVYSTAQYCMHHDICPMPNGNVLLISYELKTAAQATQAGSSQSITMWPDKIVEIQPTGATTGNVVWEWHVWDHLCQNVNPAKDNYVTSIVQHPELLNINYNTQKDWMHMNGIDYNETLDQIVFSAHNLNELYVIDHSTTTEEAAGHTGGNSGKGGDFLYRWGNPAAYQASGTTVFHVVHDAHWIPEGSINENLIVAFNNNGISNNQSCVDFIIPPYDGFNYEHTSGSAYQPSTFTLRHSCNGHSNNESNSQQLPNGNMLVCIAQSGLIYETNPAGTTIWSKQVSGMVGQAFRYSECYVTGSLTVNINATPNEICVGASVQLTANVSGGSNYGYSWVSDPPGFTSNIPDPVVAPEVTTTYFLTVSSGECTETSSVTIPVSPTPVVVASASVNETCAGQPVQLNASVTGGTSFSYSWTSDPPGFISTLENPVAYPTVTTSYFVSVSNGVCSDEDEVLITVNEAPVVVALADHTEICEGETVQLNASVTGSGQMEYSWSSNPSGFYSTIINPVDTPLVNTTYILTVIADNCQGVDSVTVTVNPKPVTPEITRIENSLVSSGAVGNQWYLEGEMIPEANSQVYNPEVNGLYSVSSTNEPGCISDLSVPYFFMFTGIDDHSNHEILYAFPNPTSGKINLILRDVPIDSTQIYLVSVFGKIVYQSNGYSSIDVSQLENGIYWINVLTPQNETITKKIAIIK